MKSEQVSAGGLDGDDPSDCTRSDPGGLQTSAGSRCCWQGDSNIYTVSAALCTSGSGTFTSLLCHAFFFRLCFFHAHTSASTHAAAVLEYPVCVIFIKTLPSTLHTKCSGNSGGRTRGFGFLLCVDSRGRSPALKSNPRLGLWSKNQSVVLSQLMLLWPSWMNLSKHWLSDPKKKKNEKSSEESKNTLVRLVIKKENTQHEIICSFVWELLSLRT